MLIEALTFIFFPKLFDLITCYWNQLVVHLRRCLIKNWLSICLKFTAHHLWVVVITLCTQKLSLSGHAMNTHSPPHMVKPLYCLLSELLGRYYFYGNIYK